VDKPTIALSLAAGLLGGILTHYLTPMPVHAQAPPTITVTAAVQSLKLPINFVDPAGNVVCAITIDPDGLPNIRLFDSTTRSRGWNREIWRARGVSNLPVTQ
jgi:hypothetical protein